MNRSDPMHGSNITFRQTLAVLIKQRRFIAALAAVGIGIAITVVGSSAGIFLISLLGCSIGVVGSDLISKYIAEVNRPPKNVRNN